MNKNEMRMLELLKDLKDNHEVIGIKAEFEAEGTRQNEMVSLCEIIHRANSELYLKIGGCEAVSDMDMSKYYGAKGIIAPMIETPFALHKFVGAAKKAFNGYEIENQLLINIETKTGFEKLDEILEVPEMSEVCGAVIGRVDLSASYGYSRKEIESDDIYEKCKAILEKLKAKNKMAGMGGGISLDTVKNINRLGSLLDRTETRKIIFDLRNGSAKFVSGLKKAIEFEYLYISNLALIYGNMSKENADRIKMLKKRLENF